LNSTFVPQSHMISTVPIKNIFENNIPFFQLQSYQNRFFSIQFKTVQYKSSLRADV
jgi:hypothetical protein